ncbi:MAG: glycosyltransferase family 4 protein [Actinomycetota bacterium]|nr:glycosyltransferase family 4 protein [Actinomycetota bacterium]
MKLLWYWPFARVEEIDLAAACAGEDSEIVVQTIDRREAPHAGQQGRVFVARDLPDVERGAMGRLRWASSRMHTYQARARLRGRLMRAHEFDLVHLHYINRFTDAYSRLPRPLVMSVHDVLPHQQRLGVQGEHRLLGRTYRRADLLVVHHERLMADLVERFGIDRSTIRVVPHQVFPVDEYDSVRPAGAPMFLFFGALRPNKGLDVLVEALRIVPKLDARVVIAGRGSPDIEDMARTLAASDQRVTCEIGQVTHQRKGELFRQASAVLLPYTSFTSQSGVLHDAYGHRRPVVVSAVGALGKTVEEDGTGQVVAPRDPSLLASAMESALDSVAWDRWVAACDRVARERAPSVVGQELRRVYLELLGAAQRP